MITLEEHPGTEHKVVYRIFDRYSDEHVDVLTRVLDITLEHAIAVEKRKGHRIVFRGIRDHGSKRLCIYEVFE